MFDFFSVFLVTDNDVFELIGRRVQLLLVSYAFLFELVDLVLQLLDFPI